MKKDVKELRKDVDRDIEIIGTHEEEPDMWRTKDTHKKDTFKTI